MGKRESKQKIDERANRISSAIEILIQKISEIENEGEIAPFNCYVARYQAQGSKYRYCYYQLKAEKAIFPKAKKEGEFSRYQHLGSSGSAQHISSVLAVVRRVQIEELTKAIDGLKESWSDLYSDEKKVGNRVD
jgi:polyhydroxyalkanoate synthesis regulator phasin